jgi:hypothetical protein
MSNDKQARQIGFWISLELWSKLKAKLEQKKQDDPFLTLSKYLRQIIANAVE